jgi:hypothetical protein
MLDGDDARAGPREHAMSEEQPERVDLGAPMGAAAQAMGAALDTALVRHLVRRLGNAGMRGLARLRLDAPDLAALGGGAVQLRGTATAETDALDADGTPGEMDLFIAQQRAVLATLSGAETLMRDAFNACHLPRSPVEAATLADDGPPDFTEYTRAALAGVRHGVRHRRYLRR